MKFVLGLVALILIGLMLYVYIDKDYKQPQKQMVPKAVKEEMATVEKTKPIIQPTVKKKNLKVQSNSEEVQKKSNSHGEIGKALTLESIENADVSKKDKEQMLDNLAYYQTSEIDIEAELDKRKTIGKGLTLESINNADVSEEEKKRMMDDLAYFQTNDIDMEHELVLQQNYKSY